MITSAKRIGVIGSGTWGTALARVLCINGHEVTLWSKFEREIALLKSTHTHPNLPGMVLPDSIHLTSDEKEAATDQDYLLFAVPSPFLRATCELVRPYVKPDQIIISVAKGIENGTLLTMTGIMEDILKKDGLHDAIRLVALSGPSHAEEVARDMPTMLISACENRETARDVQELFMNTCMRLYTNTDMLGVELCGALKNIVALASGISFGLGYGDNSRAALITRGMVEITRLGLRMGCTEQTFSGLAGIGDMMVTAFSRHSRNNRCGMLIGEGKSPADAVKEIGQVVEGINAIPAALSLAKKYNVELPIVEGVDAIINHGANPAEVSLKLMTRNPKDEENRF